MKATPQNSNFISYILILISLFILVFFTKNVFSDIQVSRDERESQTQIHEEKKQLLSDLSALQEKLADPESEAIQEIQGFTGVFSDKDILEYIHQYAGQVNSGNERIIMRDISISDDQISDIGFNKATINISAVVSSEQTLFSFLNYLTGGKGKYKFYISNFSYPMNEVSGNIQVNIPLTFYYK